jgi:hypothetical protein
MSVQTCCHNVRTDATLNCSNLLDIDRRSDDITTSSRQMLLTNKRPNTLLGYQDGNKGSDLSELEYGQNLR